MRLSKLKLDAYKRMEKLLTSRSQKSPAQAMVEFALVLPILLLVVYGLIEVGRALFIYNSVASAARQATRYGAATGLNVTGGVPLYQDCAGIRSTAQRSVFLDTVEDADILIWHDDGEDRNQVSYCYPGMTYDRNFQPSIGNSSRIRVQVSTEYSPILPFIPLQPLTISSVSARTILVSVSIALTGEPQEFDFEGTSIPTDLPTDLVPSNGGGSKSLPACDVRHGIISAAPFGLVIFNYSPALTIHIADIDIWPPPSPAGQSINRLTLGGLPIWNGAIEIDSPTAFNSFIGDVSIGPRANKYLQVSFSRNYVPNGTEKIFITFDERECPLLDSSNRNQLP